MVKNYLTVKQFAEKYPAFSVGSLRDLIFHAPFNGMNEHKVICRVGAKILINEDNFFTWVESNPSAKGGTKWQI